MSIKPKFNRRGLSHALVFLFVMIFSQGVKAGDGTFSTTDGINGTFNFCVTVRFNANATQLEYIRRGIQRGSDVIADATDGHHRFGTVNIVNDCGNGCAADAAAEYFIDNRPERAGAAGAGYGVHGKMGRFPIQLFEGIALDQFGSTIFLDGAGFAVAHEFAHRAYDLDDEYSGKRDGQDILNANCAPGVGPGASPVDDPNLSYCLMDNFITRGGMSVSQNKKMTLKEFCVASNHDPDHNTIQSLRHHNESCWETIFHLPKLWKLSAFPGLPNPIPPPSVPVTFGTSCGDQKVVLLLDRSGSMGDENRLDFAKLGATLFIKDLRSDAYLGLVSFSDNVRVDFPLTQLVNDSSRNAAINAANSLVPSGETDIGDALLVALNQLSGQNDCSSCSKTIMLLTDGDHNTGTPPQAVTQLLQRGKVTVNAVVIGNNVSVAGELTLKSIANQTGGEFYRLPTIIQGLPVIGPTGLQGLFFRLADDVNGDTVMGGRPDLIASGQVK